MSLCVKELEVSALLQGLLPTLMQPRAVGPTPCTVSLADQTVACAVAVLEWSSRAAISKRAKNSIEKRKKTALRELGRRFFRGGVESSRVHENHF